MPTSDRPLPRFDHPPVVETVLGVFFEPLDDFNVFRRSEFWGTFLKAEFPYVEERPPLDEVREEFDEVLMPSAPVVRWRDNLPSPRLWAKSSDGKHTIQIQHDALFANWERDPADSSPYLDYQIRRNAFFDKLRLVDNFVEHRIRPSTCVVSYINHLDADDDPGRLLAKSLTVWKNETSDGWLPKAETANINLSFAMPVHAGRLHMSCKPGTRSGDKKRILQFQLTARGAPPADTIDAAIAWLDAGHEWIVRGFASLTRPEMHNVWGRSQ